MLTNVFYFENITGQNCNRKNISMDNEIISFKLLTFHSVDTDKNLQNQTTKSSKLNIIPLANIKHTTLFNSSRNPLPKP